MHFQKYTVSVSAPMREVLISVRHNGCPVSDTSAANPNVHIQNLSKGRLSGQCAKRLLRLRGDPADIEAFAEDFRAHGTVRQFRRLSETDPDSQVAYFSSEIAFDPTNPSILSCIHDKGCYQHSTVSVKRGEEHWKIYTEDTSAVHELVTEIEDLGNDVTLYRTTEIGSLEGNATLDFAPLLTELTPRQQTTFETALSMDYYDADADTTIEDIADDLDVHQSTAWEHLKKAENRILTEIGQQLFTSADVAPSTHETTKHL